MQFTPVTVNFGSLLGSHRGEVALVEGQIGLVKTDGAYCAFFPIGIQHRASAIFEGQTAEGSLDYSSEDGEVYLTDSSGKKHKVSIRKADKTARLSF